MDWTTTALVDELLAHDITPVATVYHWELSQALEEAGGWADRDTAEHLARSAAVLGRALGDRVGRWTTVNEPKQVIHQGYRLGTHAPGRRDPAAAAMGNHHILLGHGLALQALRAELPTGTPVGIVLDPHPYRALEPAAHAVVDQLDAEHNRRYLQPVLQGSYPAAARPEMTPPEAVVRDGDLGLISAPLDFIGINYYRPHNIRRGDWHNLLAGEEPLLDQPGFVEYLAPGATRTDMGWLVDPSGLREILTRVHAESGGLPIFITENGCAYDDYVTPEGVVNDSERSRYIHDHLHEGLRAIADGVRLAGYFHWSLDGQLRVGLGLPAPLRPLPRRLRHPAAAAQEQYEVLRADRGPTRWSRWRARWCSTSSCRTSERFGCDAVARHSRSAIAAPAQPARAVLSTSRWASSASQSSTATSLCVSSRPVSRSNRLMRWRTVLAWMPSASAVASTRPSLAR